MNFAPFCDWCPSSGKQARFTLNLCSGMPLWKLHELTFLWFGLPGPLLKILGLLFFFACTCFYEDGNSTSKAKTDMNDWFWSNPKLKLHGMIRTIVKPLWPRTPTTPQKQKNIKWARIAGKWPLNWPPTSRLIRDILGRFKGYILCLGMLVLNRRIFASEGGSRHRSFTNRSNEMNNSWKLQLHAKRNPR